MSTPRKTNRRQFLRGESAVEAIGDLTHGTPGDAEGGEGRKQREMPSTPTYLVQLSRWLMACEFQIYLTANHPPQAADAASDALNLIEALEDQLSVYRHESEISRLNRRAANEPVLVERGLFELLQHSLELFRETNGAFDITAGPLAKVWGFFQRDARLPRKDDFAVALARVGSDKLLLNEERQTAQFTQSGVEINFGAIGKGFALDRAAALLQERQVDNFLFHGGRSSVLARGARIPAAAHENPWTIGVMHPLFPQRQIAAISLRDRAMSTSGSGTQSFRAGGKKYGHILDPRTGQPAEGVLTAVSVAPSAAAADALSTAFYVLGVDGTERYCSDHPEVAAAIIRPAAKSGMVEIVTFNFSDEDWLALP